LQDQLSFGGSSTTIKKKEEKEGRKNKNINKVIEIHTNTPLLPKVKQNGIF